MRRAGWILLSLACCAAAPPTAPDFPLAWQLLDEPQLRRIEVLYSNPFNETVCVSQADWPRRSGDVDTMSDRMFLVVGEKRFPIADFTGGICIGDCNIRVDPGKSIRGRIPYERFGLPEQLLYEKKTLIYPIFGDFCR